MLLCADSSEWSAVAHLSSCVHELQSTINRAVDAGWLLLSTAYSVWTKHLYLHHTEWDGRRSYFCLFHLSLGCHSSIDIKIYILDHKMSPRLLCFPSSDDLFLFLILHLYDGKPNSSSFSSGVIAVISKVKLRRFERPRSCHELTGPTDSLSALERRLS